MSEKRDNICVNAAVASVRARLPQEKRRQKV
jgi:hypothetical protein